MREHADTRNMRINRRAEAAYGYMLVVTIGVLLAGVIVYAA